MGVPAWVWFVIAAVAAVAGAVLLLADHGRHTAHGRERRRWAALRGWQFADADAALPDRWRHGTAAADLPGRARNLVTGSLFTTAGRRLVHVFDYERAGKAEFVLAAVQRRLPQQVVLELWLPTEFPTDAGLELLGPVGHRYAFTSDVERARPLITPELVALADDAGADVPVAWIEDSWVTAAAPLGTTPARVERLLRLLGELADLVDGVHRSGPRDGTRQPDDNPASLPAGEAHRQAERDQPEQEPAERDQPEQEPAEHEPDRSEQEPALHDPVGQEPAEQQPATHPADHRPADRQARQPARQPAGEPAEKPAGEPDGSRAS